MELTLNYLETLKINNYKIINIYLNISIKKIILLKIISTLCLF